MLQNEMEKEAAEVAESRFKLEEDKQAIEVNALRRITLGCIQPGEIIIYSCSMYLVRTMDLVAAVVGVIIGFVYMDRTHGKRQRRSLSVNRSTLLQTRLLMKKKEIGYSQIHPYSMPLLHLTCAKFALGLR